MAVSNPKKTAAMNRAVLMVQFGSTVKEASESCGVMVRSLRNRLSQSKGQDKYADAFRAYNKGGYSQSEIARQFGLSKGSFCVYVQRGGRHTQDRGEYIHWYDSSARLNPALMLFG